MSAAPAHRAAPGRSGVEHAWVEHLLRGGTTPWPDFRDAAAAPGAPGAPADQADQAVASPPVRHAERASSRADRMTHEEEPAAPAGVRHAERASSRAERMTHEEAALAEPPPWLPGAQQLELLRRLNLAGRPSAELAVRVLRAGTSDRGHPDLDLAPAGEGSEAAPPAAPPSSASTPAPAPHAPRTPAVDPTTLPADELLRVAVGLLAEDLAAAGPPAVVAPVWSVLLRRRYRVVGDPRLADPVREDLARRGRTIGGRDARVLVLGAATEQMLADAWVSRFLDVGAPPWPEWLQQWARRDTVPTRVDLVATARVWAGREGRRRVHLVLDHAALPRLVRCRTLPPPPPPVPAHAAELARRVARVLGVLVAGPDREALVGRTLLPWLTEVAQRHDPAAAPPGVPRRLRPWLRRTARRVHDDVLAGGYPVHGDPARLLDPSRGVVPTPEGALAVALAALLDGGPGAPHADRAITGAGTGAGTGRDGQAGPGVAGGHGA